jgi:hypothetical protein
MAHGVFHLQVAACKLCKWKYDTEDAEITQGPLVTGETSAAIGVLVAAVASSNNSSITTYAPSRSMRCRDSLSSTLGGFFLSSPRSTDGPLAGEAHSKSKHFPSFTANRVTLSLTHLHVPPPGHHRRRPHGSSRDCPRN